MLDGRDMRSYDMTEWVCQLAICRRRAPRGYDRSRADQSWPDVRDTRCSVCKTYTKQKCFERNNNLNDVKKST